ncbi:MAG: hypothetical protein IIC78_15320 [Chloroflexi bacterium]|nr:hypothetical protein [Chloroflexota bacterium]
MDDFDFDEGDDNDEDDDDDEDDESFGRLQQMEREEIVSHLTAAGIQCWGAESIEVLREALRVNIHDGTIVLPPQDD